MNSETTGGVIRYGYDGFIETTGWIDNGTGGG